jgi:RNA polymerase sigma-70 factor, ECF subfamily
MSEETHRRFLELHLAHQKSLFAYLLAGSRDYAEAEDLLQKVTIILLERFPEYDPALSYPAWAFGVARRQLALHFREFRKREIRLPVELLEEVRQGMESDADRLSAESRALAQCLDKLPAPSRELLQKRYVESSSLSDLAATMGQTLAALNMKLVRIRKALLDCTGRVLGEEA